MLLPPSGLLVRNTIRCQPSERLEVRCFVEQPLSTIGNLTDGKNDARLRIIADCLNTPHVAIAPRRVSGNRHHARKETTEKGGDEIESRRVE